VAFLSSFLNDVTGKKKKKLKKYGYFDMLTYNMTKKLNNENW